MKAGGKYSCKHFNQGMLFTIPECAKTPSDLIRLWMHESERVYRDKMVDECDMFNFDKLQKDIIRKIFEDTDENTIFARPLIMCHFSQGIGDNKYLPIAGGALMHFSLF